MAATLTKIGRRWYIEGTPYEMRGILKSGGLKWDPARRAWWTGKKAVAEETFEKVQQAQQKRWDEQRDETIPLDAEVIKGRVKYKGRTYYLLAERRDGTSVKLSFRDGSRVFWTRKDTPFMILKRYRSPLSINQIRAYAEHAKSYGTEDCRCYCHREPGAGRPGSILFDGCDRCGCEV